MTHAIFPDTLRPARSVPVRPRPRAKFIASALLGLIAVFYVVALVLGDGGPTWGYARAFAEAALVGGLADWFAVTAIFRRPFGLPIPHTAVIPRSQGRIADSLGAFMTENFLAPDLVAARLRDLDLAAAFARQISEPAAARNIATDAVVFLPALLDALDDDAIGRFLAKHVAGQMADTEIAPAMGRVLRVLTDQGRHHALVDSGLKEAWRALLENEAALRAGVRQRTNWFWRALGLDARAADSMIGALEKTLRDVAADPDHPIRRQIADFLLRFAAELQDSPERRRQVEDAVRGLLAHPSISDYLSDLGRAGKTALRRAATDSRDDMVEIFAGGLVRAGEALLADDAARAAINVRVRALVVALAARHGQDASRFVSDTVRSWDVHTIVGKLEQSVGPDLQYIRINGTLIGGLIGLGLHALARLAA